MINDPADVDLVRIGTDDPNGAAAGRRSPLAMLAGVAIVVLLLSGGYLFVRRGRPEPAAPVRSQPADTVVRREPATVAPLPPLDATDALVRELVRGLSSHPVVAAWLTTDQLLVNFVVVTGRIADGQTPARELKAIGPVPPFRIRTAQRTAYIDPASYRRYDRYAQAIAAIDARGAVRVYETLKPRVEDAYRNFGGSGSFDAELERAIVELLKVPVVEGEVALRSDGVEYAYADERLEALSAAQKQLVRMGPDNVRLVQGKLREVASYLQIPESRLPQPAARR